MWQKIKDKAGWIVAAIGAVILAIISFSSISNALDRARARRNIDSAQAKADEVRDDRVIAELDAQAAQERLDRIRRARAEFGVKQKVIDDDSKNQRANDERLKRLKRIRGF